MACSTKYIRQYLVILNAWEGMGIQMPSASGISSGRESIASCILFQSELSARAKL